MFFVLFPPPPRSRPSSVDTKGGSNFMSQWQQKRFWGAQCVHSSLGSLVLGTAFLSERQFEGKVRQFRNKISFSVLLEFCEQSIWVALCPFKKSDNLFSYFLTFDVLLKKSSIIKSRLKYRQKYSSVLRCKDQNWSVWTHNVLQPEGALVNTVSLAPTQYARHKTYETGFITNPHPDR